MKNYLQGDEWSIVEDGFYKEYSKISESVFSIGNGRFGQRANFEEDYTGDTLLGNYIAGVYYPDKTRVGWWKIGYPQYFAKVLNAANWIGIRVNIDGENLDLNHCTIKSFHRELNMQEGYLQRSFVAITSKGKEVRVNTVRFCSIVDNDIAAIQYSIIPINFSGNIMVTPYLDGTIKNQDANYDEVFWEENSQYVTNGEMYLNLRTKKTNFDVCTGASIQLTQNRKKVDYNCNPISKPMYVANNIVIEAERGDEITIYKYVTVVSSLYYKSDNLIEVCKRSLKKASEKGFDLLKLDQKDAWQYKWQHSDILIEGDISAQQAIRYAIFQLNQTYTGVDERLNIGPKGFTGEKYGGSSYWDTEAYCLPFYLSTALPDVARNLLLYRYKHLQKAIENAQNLGFKNGAALYPMVTMNGEECHNEWEITFEEIHRNGAIAYAIYNYVNYTGDKQYLTDYGLEVLIAISRFWQQRVNWSTDRNKYVILGVTGPNEYENNVNNNWYTNYIARWCMQYTVDVISDIKQNDCEKYTNLVKRINFIENEEVAKWLEICENIYLPENNDLGIFLQQDGYLDKEQLLVSEIPVNERPLNQNWSWDRILRSCYIKQADVLQGLYFFEEDFDIEIIRRNFNFYEPRTVHESSLSPCIHAIIASKLKDEERAYEFYLRTARLDLDDYNNDTEDGCHITSMAGTWLAVVYGFAGMRVHDNKLYFNPFLPKKWKSFSFKIFFRGALLMIKIHKKGVIIVNQSITPCLLKLYDKEYIIEANETLNV